MTFHVKSVQSLSESCASSCSFFFFVLNSLLK